MSFTLLSCEHFVTWILSLPNSETLSGCLIPSLCVMTRKPSRRRNQGTCQASFIWLLSSRDQRFFGWHPNFWFIYFVWVLFVCLFVSLVVARKRVNSSPVSLPCLDAREHMSIILCDEMRSTQKMFCCILNYDDCLKKKHLSIWVMSRTTSCFSWNVISTWNINWQTNWFCLVFLNMWVFGTRFLENQRRDLVTSKEINW